MRKLNGFENYVLKQALKLYAEKCEEEVALAQKTKRNNRLTDGSRIHLVRRTEKRVYANGNILIDDFPKNTKEWKQNKGIPILYKSANQVISDLKKLGYK